MDASAATTFCGNNPAERPEGFWREVSLGNPDATDWISEVELRSFQSMRPIWSQIIQLEHTRMALLLGHVERIPSFLSKQMVVQARVDGTPPALLVWRRLCRNSGA